MGSILALKSAPSFCNLVPVGAAGFYPLSKDVCALASPDSAGPRFWRHLSLFAVGGGVAVTQRVEGKGNARYPALNRVSPQNTEPTTAAQNTSGAEINHHDLWARW